MKNKNLDISYFLPLFQTVPHGVLCFLPSYRALEKFTARWKVNNVFQN